MVSGQDTYLKSVMQHNNFFPPSNVAIACTYIVFCGDLCYTLTCCHIVDALKAMGSLDIKKIFLLLVILSKKKKASLTFSLHASLFRLQHAPHVSVSTQ